ncbi:MAG: class I tRNA ligase family protein, partial [Phycisphaerales bacterium]|nr:class I tRNA ligase family protein [Phycisphaerales bacterium]
DSRGIAIPYTHCESRDGKMVHTETGEVLVESVEKMSKGLGNVVNPDEIIGEFGADTFRLYEMFMGPLNASKPWNTRDVPGVFRFLQRAWRMVAGDENSPALLTEADQDDVEKLLHRLAAKVGDDIEQMKFNTAIAAMMEFVNAVFKNGAIGQSQAERFVLILAPFAPHLAEELWSILGHGESMAYEPFPSFDEAMLTDDTVELAVQVCGKMRGKVSVAADADEATILAAVQADAKVAAHLEGKAIVKTIVVPGRLVNLIAK